MSDDQPDQPLPVSVERAAGIFSVTEKTIRSWIRAGLPVLKAGGKGRGNGAMLDLADLIPWYLEENALDVAKTRLATAQAEKHEMDNAARRGEQADMPLVVLAWSEHIAAARAKLLSMPTKLGPQLINVADPNVVATRIRVEVHAAIDELAQWEPPAVEDNSEELEEDADDVAKPATVNGKRVGRRKPQAQ